MPIRSLREYAPDLELGPEGWWVSRAVSDVSYAEEGNALCYLAEDSSFWFEHRNRCILEAMKRFPPGGTLFDVGGGNGFVARALQESGLEVVVVEPGLAGVRNAVKRGVRQVVRSTFEDAGLLAESVPAVGLFDVLEHIRDDCGFLTRTNRLMMPGGRVYITSPAYQWLWSDEDILAGHFRRYTLAGLSYVLEKAGYAIDFATYIFSPLPLPILLRRVLPYSLGCGRSRVSESAIRSDHEVVHPMARRILQNVSRWELSRIAKQHPLAFGGSCLVVARSRPGDCASQRVTEPGPSGSGS
jgi:Methyltransferase domain